MPAHSSHVIQHVNTHLVHLEWGCTRCLCTCVCVHLTCTLGPSSTRPLHSTRCPARARVRSDREGTGQECGSGRQGGCAELEGGRQDGRDGSWREGKGREEWIVEGRRQRGIYFLHSRHPAKLLDSSSFCHLKRKKTHAHMQCT